MAQHEIEHIPVMRDAAISALQIRACGCYLDATFGRGGHAREILARLASDGQLLLMDRDPQAVAAAQSQFAGDARVTIRHASFAELGAWPAASELDGALFDLGVSSPQIDTAERGFSFMADAPLDMRMDPTQGDSVADFLAHADERDIAEVLWRYGEERKSRRIARAIVARNQDRPLQRTAELAELIARTIGRREPGKHPATRSFQALRIHVNGELDALQLGLDAVLECLKVGARLVLISFHSLEDRMVKRFIRAHSGVVVTDRRRPPVPAPPARLKAVGKAQFPSAAEAAANPRARSAVMRVAEKLA